MPNPTVESPNVHPSPPPRWLRRVSSKLGRTLAPLLVLSSGVAGAQSLDWESSPTEIHGLFHDSLDSDARAALSGLIALERRGGSFGEQLLVAPLRAKDVRIVGGGISPKFDKMSGFIEELRAIPEYPMLAAFNREQSAVDYLERRLAQATPEQRPRLEQQLLAARERLRTFEERVTARTPTEFERILLSWVRDGLAGAGFSVPELEPFIRGWPRFLATYLSESYLELEFPIDSEIPPTAAETLRQIEAVHPDFRWYPATVAQLYPETLAGLPATQLGYRISSLRNESGELVVRASLMYNTVQFLLRQQHGQQYVPTMLWGDVTGGGGMAAGVGLHSALCFEFSALPGTGVQVGACGNSTQALWFSEDPPALALPTEERGQCDDAHAIGQVEGRQIHAALLPSGDVCAAEALETTYLEAFAALEYAIKVGRFKPIRGLEGAQPCRHSGQNAGISDAHLKATLSCAGAQLP